LAINAESATSALIDLVREDRNEARIWRARLESSISGVLLASFAISAFFIGKANALSIAQLRVVTLLVDLCLLAVIVIFFLRARRDLIALRKGQRYRQDLLKAAVQGAIVDFEPFLYPGNTRPAITDEDMDWLFGLSVGLLLVKTVFIAGWPTIFLTFLQSK
jgi:hypothetical protein